MDGQTGGAVITLDQKDPEKQDVAEQREGAVSIQDMELKEEWQDEEFPGPLPEEVSEEDLEDSGGEPSPVAPNTLELCGKRHMKKRLPAPDLSLSLDRAEGSVLSGNYPEPTPDGSLDINVDELETPSESEVLDGPEGGHDFEWEDELPRARRLDSSLLEEKLSEGRMVDVEDKDGRKWRIFLTDEQEQKVDLSIIEPYKRVISHGGYYGEGLNAIILFASCYLPHSSVPDYPYVMEQLFRYIIGTLEVMVAESYILVCLNGATLRSQIPSFGWIKQCYRTIDRRLRKNLKAMIIVHPTWYVKALMTIIRPFLRMHQAPAELPTLSMFDVCLKAPAPGVSSKFGRKVQFVDSLWELSQQIPLEQVHIPDCIRQLDRSWNSSRDTQR
ncbi:bcl-2/adenovirus E1B 19 kDa-interacting protein 2-like protein isoform X2 [Dermochelys coriacea]|uniref:bcl-2/adenovirus E1B 19 kDa-interacting protein 2-like protein isoform X2 n=1 Tax=Dermochelys coriacea TaxID=27794 RepID=UPI0018E7107F|nr:bcl-2/adenovirus E1B 19 kDa-interacting protein 2-like protein isoform X2 [Dermochelys coriacea]